MVAGLKAGRVRRSHAPVTRRIVIDERVDAQIRDYCRHEELCTSVAIVTLIEKGLAVSAIERSVLTSLRLKRPGTGGKGLD